MRAREYFEQVRATERDLRRARERLDAADEAMDGLVGRQFGAVRVSGGAPTSWGPLSRLEGQDDALQVYMDRLDRLVAVEDEAMGVIDMVRPDGDPMIGARWREALQYRFLSDLEYDGVAEKMGVCERSARSYVVEALAWIDGHNVFAA